MILLKWPHNKAQSAIMHHIMQRDLTMATMKGIGDSKLAPGGAPATPKKNIDKQDIQKLPLIAWEGRIEVLETTQEMERAVSNILKNAKNKRTALGFDT